ncbi:MAG: cell division protein FtsA [Moraxellaceae bacterium]|jgi:cell division protein FtsA|nr:cell division protein FtsA [Moraxellaceae bacterium]
MASATNNPMIVGIDIGTSKVVALVGQLNAEGALEIVGVGMKPSRGMKKGMVVNIEQTVQSIQGAVGEAELMADCKIHSGYIGISGAHIGGRNSQAVVAIRDGEVQQSDIERVIDAAKSGPIPADQRILHILPQEFQVDDQADVRDPLGMSGVRLEGHVHLVTCSVNALQNIEKCVRSCGIEIDGVILQQLASSYAVLTEDEKEHGICLVDVGGGTTDVAIFSRGAIRHTAVIAVAGDQVTNDIATALYTPTQDADEIKTKYACAVAQLVDPEQTINVPGMGDRPARKLSRQTLAEVVEPRYDELFMLVQQEIEKSGFAGKLAAGIVLTGGSAKIEGATALAESIFHMPVRIGMPQSLKVGGMGEVLRNPIYSTGVGLLLYGKKQVEENQHAQPVRKNAGGGLGDAVQKMRNWLVRNF